MGWSWRVLNDVGSPFYLWARRSTILFTNATPFGPVAVRKDIIMHHILVSPIVALHGLLTA